MFPRSPKLDLQVTHDLGAGEVTWRAVFPPASNYAALFESGAVANLDWPNGSQDPNAGGGMDNCWELDGGVWVPSVETFTIRPNLFDGYGVVSWEIDAGPGFVPGTLHVACYKSGTALDSPDSLTDYALGPGSWSTGPLPKSNAEFSPDQWYEVRLRFVPEHLQSLL